MRSEPSHDSPQPDELLPWFVKHMRSLGEWEFLDNHANTPISAPTDRHVHEEDEAEDQGTSTSVNNK